MRISEDKLGPPRAFLQSQRSSTLETVLAVDHLP
jgi:hypothetical protein